MGVHTARLHGTCFYYTAYWMGLQGKDGRIEADWTAFPKLTLFVVFCAPPRSGSVRAVSVPFTSFHGAQLVWMAWIFSSIAAEKADCVISGWYTTKDLQAGSRSRSGANADQGALVYRSSITEKWGVMPTAGCWPRQLVLPIPDPQHGLQLKIFRLVKRACELRRVAHLRSILGISWMWMLSLPQWREFRFTMAQK